MSRQPSFETGPADAEDGADYPAVDGHNSVEGEEVEGGAAAIWAMRNNSATRMAEAGTPILTLRGNLV